jgi:3,4-dihydroxy 2-butanone 4-phosphate synthase / GTP cyclohydrolase II
MAFEPVERERRRDDPPGGEMKPRGNASNGFVVMDPDPYKRVELGIEDIRAGHMVILVDDEDRENEGDLTMAAEKVTPEAINFMATFGRGLICLSLTESRVVDLGLPMMAVQNHSTYGTAFTVSIEAREGVSTGISAFDRAKTISVAIDPRRGPNDIVTPGHVFPLRAREQGVLVRTGQTEGSVDIARLAGLYPAGVICEIMNEDGSMARMPDLERFGARHGIRIVTVADLVRWRLRYEVRLERVLEGVLPVAGLADFQLRAYRSTADSSVHLSLSLGDLASGVPLVRLQPGCLAGDVFHSLACDCRGQIDAALAAIAREGCGVLVYSFLEGLEPNQRLLDRLREHLLPSAPEAEPAAASDPELREYGTGAQVLLDLGVRKLRLLTNNPRKIVGLEAYGLFVTERLPIETESTAQNRSFLEARRDQLGHLLRKLDRGGAGSGGGAPGGPSGLGS